jgi:hypothetical protein
MSSSAQIGAGTTLGYGSTLGGSYTSYGEVLDVNMPSGEIAKIDVTHYLSDTTNFVKDFISGKWKEYGNLVVKLNYLAAQTVLLNTHFGLQQFFKITLPDGCHWRIPGFICKFGGAIPNKDAQVTQDVEICVTSAPTFFQNS